MAAKFDFSVDQLADSAVQITYAPGGVPFDLSGWAVRMQARVTVPSPTAALELSTTAGTISVSTSVISLNFTASLVTQVGKYFYDVVATNGSSVRRICEGTISVNPAITR